MYRTLTDPKPFRCLPHRRIILYYIYGNLHGPLLNIILQKTPPANIVFTMYAGGLKVIQRRVRFPDSATYGPVYYNSRLLSFSRKSYTLIVVIPFSSRNSILNIFDTFTGFIQSFRTDPKLLCSLPHDCHSPRTSPP